MRIRGWLFTGFVAVPPRSHLNGSAVERLAAERSVRWGLMASACSWTTRHHVSQLELKGRFSGVRCVVIVISATGMETRARQRGRGRRALRRDAPTDLHQRYAAWRQSILRPAPEPAAAGAGEGRPFASRTSSSSGSLRGGGQHSRVTSRRATRIRILSPRKAT